MRRTTRFRQLVEAPEILVLPGAHDALSLRLIERAGFAACTAGGFAISGTLLGAPDVNQLSMTEMAEQYARLCDQTGLPLFADGDTGHGNATNVARTVRAFERAGVAGLFIEDQVSPKRCGHMDGKSVIPLVEMLAKLRAALDARVDPDLVVMARTDALAVNGLEDALERAVAFREAGADLIFVESPTTVDQMRRICSAVAGPCLANNLDGGKSPIIPASELQAIGYAAVAFPVGASFTVARALEAYYGALRRDGTSAALSGNMVSFAEYLDLVGLQELRARETAWLQAAERQLQTKRAAN